jgi:mannose-6-phosphate isomerase-like protein (cupin superfamily)
MERVKPIRRIITAQDENENPVVLADGPAPKVITDPARPGYSSSTIWVTDSTPARIRGVKEAVHLDRTIEPPTGGSVCRIVTIPPDASFRNRVGAKEVQAFFKSVGSPGASTYSADGSHPYRQKTITLDFCIVLEGEITLILDKEEVNLKKGDIVVQRGTNHSWSNRSDKPCVMVFSQHDGRFSK